MSTKLLRRKIIILFILSVLSLILTLHYPAKLTYAGLAPDFLLLLILSAGFFFGLNEAMILGFLTGLTKDFFLSTYPGSGALFYMYMALLGFYLFRKLMFGPRFSFFIKAVILSLISSFVPAVFILLAYPSRIMSFSEFTVWWAIDKTLPLLFMNLILSLPFYLIFNLLLKKLRKGNEELFVTPMKII